MRIHTIKAKGFTLIEVMIVVAIIGFLVAMAYPPVHKARLDAQKNVCIENLTQIETAKQLFALEKGGKAGDPIYESDLIGPVLYIKTMPQCPAGGTYNLESVGTNATCDPLGFDCWAHVGVIQHPTNICPSISTIANDRGDKN